jgi:hypothetical protein
MTRNHCVHFPRNSLHLIVAGLFAALSLLTFLGCNIRKQGEGKAEKVDINTPIGSLHVSKQPDPKDVGLPIYPGAERVMDKNDEGANVSIESSMFGLRVVALKYKTGDGSDKVLDFYRKELKTFGDVGECQGDFAVTATKAGAQSSRCVPSKDKTELAAGTPERRHYVSVKPLAKGCQFELVYVQTRGERESL